MEPLIFEQEWTGPAGEPLPIGPADPATQLAVDLEAAIPVHYLQEPTLLHEVATRWCERHRAWHGPAHLRGMLAKAAALPKGEQRDILSLAALYHDAIYDPRANDNEEASATLLRQHAADADARVITKAVEVILASKWAQPPDSPQAREFFEWDAHTLAEDCPLQERVAYEHAIFREYQWAGLATYRKKRREFLEGWAERFPRHRRGVAECLELLAALRPRVAVYPGSFHPFHRGHLSILRQAESVFDQVIIAVGVNRQKPGAAQSAEARHSDLQERLRFHEVASYHGLLTRFVEEMELPVTIVRGVRDGTDLEAELRFTRFLNELRPQTGVVWISCEAELQHLSSSAIRELEGIEPGAGQRYLPETHEIYDLQPAP